MVANIEKLIVPVAGGYQPRPVSVWQGAYTLSSFAAAEASSGIDILVDWDGGDNLGTFKVWAQTAQNPPATEWVHCENLNPNEMPNKNDVIYPAFIVSGTAVQVRFQRGPTNPGRQFQVKAVPIYWKEGISSTLDPNFIAKRPDDYDYRKNLSSFASVPDVSQISSLVTGTQTLTLNLESAYDYEIHVSLLHPTDNNLWLVQDPIFRTGNGSRLAEQ